MHITTLQKSTKFNGLLCLVHCLNLPTIYYFLIDDVDENWSTKK